VVAKRGKLAPDQIVAQKKRLAGEKERFENGWQINDKKVFKSAEE